MKKIILATVSLLSVSVFAYDPKVSNEVAVCTGVSNGSQKEITVFRDFANKSKASVLYKDLSTPVIAYQNNLFTEAVATRANNSLEVKHEKITITIDLASEKTDKTMSGKWDNQVDLNCKIITPIVD